MSEEVKAVKRRGRPKKSVEVDSIVVIDSSQSGPLDGQATKLKKSTTRKSTTPLSDIDTTTKKRTTRKGVSKDEVNVEIPKVTKTRRSAKSIENVTSTLENSVNLPAQAQDVQQSKILSQATAFRSSETRDSAGVKDIIFEQSPDSVASTSHPTIDIEQTEQSVSSRLEPQLELSDTQTRIETLTSALRLLSFERVELSLSQLSHKLEQSNDFVRVLRSSLERRAHNVIRTQHIQSEVASLEETVRLTSSGIQDFLRQRLVNQSQAAGVRFDDLATEIRTISAELNDLKSARLLRAQASSKVIEHLTSKAESLSIDILESEALLHSYTTRLQQAETPHPILTTTTQPLMDPSSQHQHHHLSHPQGQAHANKPLPSHPRFLSTKPAPLIPHLKPPNPNSNPNPQPQPLRPTQLPYETLRKDPRFKAQSRKWTGIIVGIPVLIATSWVLYLRHQDTIKKRFVVDKGRLRGELPTATEEGNASTKGMGVDRSSNVGVNGGV